MANRFQPENQPNKQINPPEQNITVIGIFVKLIWIVTGLPNGLLSIVGLLNKGMSPTSEARPML